MRPAPTQHFEFRRFATIQELFNKLKVIESLEDKMQFKNNTITITFHNDFVLTIKPFGGLYREYVNGIFSSDAEDEDIWYSIDNLVRDTYEEVYIEYKGLFKRKIKVVARKYYERKKEKFLQKPMVKIYTVTELIYQSK